MLEFILPAGFGFLATVLAVYPTIKLAKKYGLVDNPKTRPHPAHIHKKIIPRAGGLALFFGIIVTTLIFIPIEKHILGILGGSLILLITGLLDDKSHNFSPYLRLLIQIIAATLVVGSGVGIHFITNPLGGILKFDDLIWQFNLLGIHKVIILADVLAILWIVWILNMLNWSKGIDGQLPGIVLIAVSILGLLSLKLYLAGDFNQINIAKLSFITAGVSLGFLVFNWHPAKIFPGFSGSNILGLMIATIAILSGAKLATAGLVLLVPATDFIYTFTRRVLSGKSPVWGDRGHLHHKLLDLGLSHQKITLFYMLGSAILGAVALALDSRGKFFAASLVGISILGGILWLNFFGVSSRKPDQNNG